MKPNEIEVNDTTMIFIQACDETFAHIGIRTNGRVFYRHYSFPAMEMDKERRYPDDLSDKEFAKIIDDNKDKVIETIEKLNQ